MDGYLPLSWYQTVLNLAFFCHNYLNLIFYLKFRGFGVLGFWGFGEYCLSFFARLLWQFGCCFSDLSSLLKIIVEVPKQQPSDYWIARGFMNIKSMVQRWNGSDLGSSNPYFLEGAATMA